MTTEKKKKIALVSMICFLASIIIFVLVMSYVGRASLTEGEVYTISSYAGSRPAKAEVQVAGLSYGFYVQRKIILNQLPDNIKVYDKVKIITLPSGEVTLEKIPNPKGDSK